MRVIWTPEAQQDRANVWDYIAADNPRAAARMDELFSDAAARLTDHPMLGRHGQIEGTRELIPPLKLSPGVRNQRGNRVDADPSSYRAAGAARTKIKGFAK